MHATQQAPKWVPPLPPGWEAKFDPGQHTYFFINHHTKTTQWEDPRFQQQAAPAAKPTSAASAAASSLSQLGNKKGSSTRYESVQMKDFRSSAEGTQRTQLRESQRESSLINTGAIVQKLQTEFPAATSELIVDLLTSFQNDEARTHQEMISLGFEVKPSPSSGQAGLSHHVSGSSRTMSPTKRSNQGASPAKQQPKPQPKREVSIAEKARIINQLKREFPNSDPNVISIAATTCEFDMDKTKELIQAFEKKSDDHQDRHKGTRVSVTSSGPTSSPSSQPTQPSQQSLFPAGLSEEIPREGQSGTFSQHGPGHSKGSATVQGGTVSRSAQPQQARAQHVTSFYFRPKQKKTRQTAVVTSQPEPQRPAAECSNRTPTVGPNQELLRGPDSSLLSSEHIQAQGPNKALRVGPDLSRVAGPQGCKGADVTLSCGPQHGLLCHQQQDRVVTPSGILVSSI